MQICAWCRSEFEAPVKEMNRGNGRFCSLGCSASYGNAHRASKLVDRVCLICGQHYKVKACRTGNTKYCSRACLDASKVRDGSYKAKREAFATLPNKCAHCSSTEDLVLHHIDGNHLNNEPSNWRITCRKHHILLEHPEVLDNLSSLNASHPSGMKE